MERGWWMKGNGGLRAAGWRVGWRAGGWRLQGWLEGGWLDGGLKEGWMEGELAGLRASEMRFGSRGSILCVGSAVRGFCGSQGWTVPGVSVPVCGSVRGLPVVIIIEEPYNPLKPYPISQRVSLPRLSARSKRVFSDPAVPAVGQQASFWFSDLGNARLWGASTSKAGFLRLRAFRLSF